VKLDCLDSSRVAGERRFEHQIRNPSGGLFE
jgi:hypothetical protein